MKLHYLPAFFLILIFSCKQKEYLIDANAQKLQQQAIDYQHYQQANTGAYQSLPAFVAYYRDSGQPAPAFAIQNDFIASSGLPLQADIVEWSQHHSIDEAVALCKAFIEHNNTHPYLNTFKQYSGWLLMTHYHLLDEGSANQQTVLYLLNNLAEARYKGYQLLYLGLRYLSGRQQYKEVARLSQSIVSYGATEKTDIPLAPGKDADTSLSTIKDPRTRSMVEQYIEQQKNSHEYLEKISLLATV